MLSPMSDPTTVTLRGGRTLGYREYGDPDGAPVVNCHPRLFGRSWGL